MSRNDWIVVIVALIAYQAYTTVLVIKSDDFDDDIKLRQVVVIWLIPVIGAVLVRMRINRARIDRQIRELGAAPPRDER